MQKELIQTGGKVKAFRERAETTPNLDLSPDQDANTTEQDGVEQALLTQRLQEQYGHDHVTDAISGDDTSPMGTLILAEWALATAGLDSLVEGEGGSPQAVFSTLHSDDWAATSSAVLSRYEKSSQPGHAHLAAELIRRSRGQRLPTDVAARLSAALGTDISDAVIHTDSAAAQAAAAVNAHAFATGKDVFFGQGKYRPGTREGDELLAHELTHVVQDAEGRIPTASGQGLTVSSPSDAHEREAEHVAHDAMDALYGTSAIEAETTDTSAATETSSISANDGVLHRSETEGNEESTADSEIDYHSLARQIRDAIVGLGTDETAVYDALSQLGGDASKFNQLTTVYQQLFNTSLEEDLDGDFSGAELDRVNELAQREKAAFLAQEQYGPMDLAHARPGSETTGLGGFEATYIPAQETLIIRMTGNVRFQNAVDGSHPSLTTQHTDMLPLVTYLNSLPADVVNMLLPYYQWDDPQKAVRLAQYNERLRESEDIWENTGLYFQLDDPEWSEIRATTDIQLELTEEGSVGADEHLQISIFKEPTAEEQTDINSLLFAAGESSMGSIDQGIRANAGANLGYNAPGAPSSGNFDRNPFQNEMCISEDRMDNTANDSERGGSHFLKRSLMFDNGSDTPDASRLASAVTWASSFDHGDSISENNDITLRGFASASGSTEFNRELVERRITAVKDALILAGIPSTRITTDNLADIEAESDLVGSDQDAQANERRVEILIGSGERQNTLAHEFGHVFGLTDEYVAGSRSAGDESWQHQRSIEAGVAHGAHAEDNDNIISVGNEVRPQHYSTFAWALNQLTESTRGDRMWHVKE